VGDGVYKSDTPEKGYVQDCLQNGISVAQRSGHWGKNSSSVRKCSLVYQPWVAELVYLACKTYNLNLEGMHSSQHRAAPLLDQKSSGRGQRYRRTWSTSQFKTQAVIWIERGKECSKERQSRENVKNRRMIEDDMVPKEWKTGRKREGRSVCCW
jgi:hypothetical protein